MDLLVPHGLANQEVLRWMMRMTKEIGESQVMKRLKNTFGPL